MLKNGHVHKQPYDFHENKLCIVKINGMLRKERFNSDRQQFQQYQQNEQSHITFTH